MANFFTEKSMINSTSALITGDEAAHIARVLRMKAGESLTLCDGEGMFYDSVISEIEGGVVRVKIEKAYPAPTEPKVQITLFQAIPKNPKMDFIVRKATEVGVVRIVPMNTARIVARLEKESKAVRLQKIALEAAKQSRRGVLPVVESPVPFERAAEMAAVSDLAIIPYEEEQRLPIKSCLQGKQPKTLAIMIGPEGGFEEEEIRLARAKGITSVTLGKRILRTETAGLVAAALALYELGDME